MTAWDEPSELNHYLEPHAARLLASFSYWTTKNLIAPDLPPAEQARELFYAPFVVLSHNIAPDPILNYANRAGLRLFELSWDELTTRPSRLTAEPMHQDERALSLSRVTQQGYIDDYRGVRISKSGRRFFIDQATVSNLRDENGTHCGQAATFSRWRYVG